MDKGIDSLPLVHRTEEVGGDGEKIVLTSKDLAFKQEEDERRTLIPDKPFLPNPMRIKCKKCNAATWTLVEKHNSMATYLFCFLICFTGLGSCCCCFIPCCMDRCKVVQHTCSSCKNYLGEYYPK